MNYEKSGVSLKKAEEFNLFLSKDCDLESGFAALFDLPFAQDYQMVSCTDGVGTKIIPLLKQKMYKTIAQDLVAMNLNDICCCGAKPLFFLDYLAVNKLDVKVASQIIKYLKEILEEYNCKLIGGETAELKDIINKNVLDISGFAIGYVKKDQIINKANDGDILIALSSNGPHSNGFTLLRKLKKYWQLSKNDFEKCLEPTPIYTKEINELTDKGLINACAHITGGGIGTNLARIIPDGYETVLYGEELGKAEIWKKLVNILGREEAFKTFNMGAGMIVATSLDKVNNVIETCSKYEPFIIGKIKKRNDK